MSIEPLKVDLHIHTKEDPRDRISYSAYKLIDQAFTKGYDALAITNHQIITCSTRLKSYAAERGIVLIPGVEAIIEGKHFLLINMPFDNGCLDSIEEVLKQKAANNLVIAPHPYFPGPNSLGGRLEAFPHLFDAIEYCHLYNHKMNFNKKAVRFAHKHMIPLVGNSDAHLMEQFGLAYSLVEAEKETDAIIQSIKAGRVEAVSGPLPMIRLAWILMRVLIAERQTWERPVKLIWMVGAFMRSFLNKVR